MWTLVLIALIIVVGWWSYTRGPGIVVPVPVSAVKKTKEHTGTGGLMVWRVLIVFVLIPLAFLLFLSTDPGLVTIGTVSALAAAVLFSSIKDALIDIWHFRFPTLGGN